jgi:hypothetical protein
MRPGCATMHGTLTEVSYMFCGRVPLPLPQMPWWPQFIPLSPMNTTSVLWASPCASSSASTRPIAASIALTAAK